MEREIVGIRYEARSCGRSIGKAKWSLPTPFGFSSLRNAHTTEPTTIWDAIFSHSVNTMYSFSQWSGARPVGERCWEFGPMSIPSEVGQTTKPTTAWAAVSYPNANTAYSFLHLIGLGRTVVTARPNEHYPCLKKKVIWHERGSNPRLLYPESNAPLCHSSSTVGKFNKVRYIDKINIYPTWESFWTGMWNIYGLFVIMQITS